jgi:hypothetical protein
VAILLEKRRAASILVLSAYDHTVQFLRRRLTQEFFKTLCETFLLVPPGLAGDTMVAEVMEVLQIRTVRSARGATADAVFFIATTRNVDEPDLKGQLLIDHGLRRVAFSRARSLMVVLCLDDIMQNSSSPHRFNPGFGNLADVWPSARYSEPERRFAHLFAANRYPSRTIQDVACIAKLLACWTAARAMHSASQHQAGPYMPQDSTVVGPQSITVGLQDVDSRQGHAQRLLRALDARKHAPAPQDESDAQVAEDVQRFNQEVIAEESALLESSSASAAAACSSAANAIEELTSYVHPIDRLDAGVARWLPVAAVYAVPTIHWHLSADSERDAENPKNFPHLVSMPMFQRFLPGGDATHPWDEHLQLAKLFCPPLHHIEVLKHKGHTVHTEHAVHYWKECNSERYAVAVVRDATPAAGDTLPQSPRVRLYAYHGMGTQRMLPSLQGIVLRIADLGMVQHVAVQLGRHWPSYTFQDDNFIIWGAEAAQSDRILNGLRDAWERGVSRRTHG